MPNSEIDRLLSELLNKSPLDHHLHKGSEDVRSSTQPEDNAKAEFPNETEATRLLSTYATVPKGIEMVLGRVVGADELLKDDYFRDVLSPVLDGQTRYAMLLMKKAADPKEQKGQNGV